MAPEVVKQVAYTKKADIWSVGCLIVEMITGEHPWAQLNQMQAIFKVPFIMPMSLNRLWLTFWADRFFWCEAPDPVRHIC